MKKLLKNLAVRNVIAWMIARLLTLLLLSIRWDVQDEAAVQALVSGPPCIIAFWHESLPVLPVLWLMVRRRGMTRRTVILASKNSDGQLIGLTLQHMGADLVSGSSRHGGKEAYEALITVLSEGAHVAITPDGPRGPRRQARPGVAMLAARSGITVLPVGAASRPAITVGSWDAMRIPLPFGKGVLRFGAPIKVPTGDWEASLPRIEAALTATLDEALALCEGTGK